MRRAVAVAAVAALLAVSPAVAQEPAAPPAVAPAPPAPEAAAPPAPLSPAPAPEAAPAASAPRGALDGWELDVSIWGGPYSGGASEAGAGGFDAALLVRAGLLAGGVRLGSERLASAFASTVAATGGALVPLSAATRLDLLADAGLGLHMIPRDGIGCEPGTLCDEREGANRLRPVLGARAGFTFLSGDGRLAFSLGAFARVVPEQKVDLQRRTCLFTCTTATETKVVGGSVVGAFLAVGFPRRF